MASEADYEIAIKNQSATNNALASKERDCDDIANRLHQRTQQLNALQGQLDCLVGSPSRSRISYESSDSHDSAKAISGSGAFRRKTINPVRASWSHPLFIKDANSET